MPRALLRLTYLDSEGDVQGGRALTFYESDGTTPITTTIYANATGATPATLVTDSNGEWLGWSNVEKLIYVTAGGVTKPEKFVANRKEVWVEDFGAKGDYSTDDTTAIQAAITYIKTIGGGIIHLGPGNFMVSQLDCTATVNIKIEGSGYGATAIRPNTAGVNALLDISGSYGFELQSICLGNTSGTSVKSILLYGDPAAGQPGAGLDNASHFQTVVLSGLCTKATVAIYGAASSDMIDGHVYNYLDAGASGAPALLITGNNDGSAPMGALASSFLTLNTANNLPASDWTFTSCEFHGFNTSDQATTVWLDGAGKISFYGGNISSARTTPSRKADYVRLSKTGANSVTNPLFDGVTFYTDSNNVPLYGVSVYTASDAGVKNLRVIGGGIQAFQSLVAVAGGATVTGLQVHTESSGAATNAVYPNGGSHTITDLDVNAVGLEVNAGAAGTIGYGKLQRPGALTGTSILATVFESDGSLSVKGGAVTIGATGAATTGNLRLQNQGSLVWRNAAGGANLTGLTIGLSNALTLGSSGVDSITALADTAFALKVNGNTLISGNGTGLGFFGHAESGRQTYTVTNGSTDRALNVSGDTTAQVAAVVGTLISDLQAFGLLA